MLRCTPVALSTAPARLSPVWAGWTHLFWIEYLYVRPRIDLEMSINAIPSEPRPVQPPVRSRAKDTIIPCPNGHHACSWSSQSSRPVRECTLRATKILQGALSHKLTPIEYSTCHARWLSPGMICHSAWTMGGRALVLAVVRDEVQVIGCASLF